MLSVDGINIFKLNKENIKKIIDINKRNYF